MSDQTENPGPAGNDETMPESAQSETTTLAAPSDGRFRRFRDRSIKLWAAAVAMLAVLVLGGLSGAAIHAAAADGGHGDRHGQFQRGERDGRGGEFRDDRMPPGGVPGTPPSTPPNETPDPEGSTDSSGDAT
jgi:hypothetical protein